MSKPRRGSRAEGCARTAIGLAAALGLYACDGKPPPAQTMSHALPPLDPGAAPAPGALPRAEHPPSDPMAGPTAGLPAGHPPMAGHDPHAHGDPHGRDSDEALAAATPGDIPFDPKTIMAGRITLDGKLKDKVKPGDVIYLVARAPGAAAAPGTVVAVKRLEAGTFPLDFQLDSRDAMVAGTELKLPLTLTARVDKDGDAMTKNPGDVTGTLTIGKLPAPKLNLKLDTAL